MASRTKVIIAILVLLVASKLHVRADGVNIDKGHGDHYTVSRSAHSFGSIGNQVAAPSPVPPIKRLHAIVRRRLDGADDSTNNNVTVRASHGGADNYGNNNFTAMNCQMVLTRLRQELRGGVRIARSGNARSPIV